MYYKHIRRCCVSSGFGRTLLFTSASEEGDAVCLVWLVGYFALRAASAKSAVELNSNIFSEKDCINAAIEEMLFSIQTKPDPISLSSIGIFFFFTNILFHLPCTFSLSLLSRQFFSIIYKPVKALIPVLGEKNHEAATKKCNGTKWYIFG